MFLFFLPVFSVAVCGFPPTLYVLLSYGFSPLLNIVNKYFSLLYIL